MWALILGYIAYWETINPTANVAAFEPMPFFYDLLASNIKINMYDIVHRQQAASNEKGSQTFYVATAYQGNIYSSTLVREHFAAHQSTAPQPITVDTVTLRSFLDEVAWQGKGLIKIDAEGHDIEVIKGLGDYIVGAQILVEINYEDLAKRLNNLPFMNRYKCFGINDKTNKLTEALSAPDDKNCDNFLFLPTNWDAAHSN